MPAPAAPSPPPASIDAPHLPHGRLRSELDRLYRAEGADQLRAVALELARPADWDALAKVWRGVQADLNLPAPAIAVSGIDGYRLWFSFVQQVPAAQALAFVKSLQGHYLPDIARSRVSIIAADDAVLPPQRLQPDQWSAFIAPDLAPVFADEPWLDTPPSPEGQADLLSRIASIKSAELQAALEKLGAAAPIATVAAPAPSIAAEAIPDPKRFLLNVMNDSTVALGLRIEAAKALLPWFDDTPRR